MAEGQGRAWASLAPTVGWGGRGGRVWGGAVVGPMAEGQGRAWASLAPTVGWGGRGRRVWGGRWSGLWLRGRGGRGQASPLRVGSWTWAAMAVGQ